MIPESKYLYLWINFFTILVPLIRSFEGKIAFYKSFKAIGLSLLFTNLFFVIWDVIFTHMGVWGFNPKYLSGIYLFGLPLGEYLFFITVPYACLFVYRVLNYFITKDVLAPYGKHISNFLIGFSFALAATFYYQWYTFTTFLFLGLFIAYLQFKEKAVWLSRFYLAYAVCIIPFFIVNGILTGSGIEEQVVWYNDAENLSKRLFTIPVEDIFYGMLLIMMTVFWYERFYPSTGNQNG